MHIAVDLDKTLIDTALCYNYIDANESLIINGSKSYDHLLYNKFRPINGKLLCALKEQLKLGDNVTVLTGSWSENIPNQYRNYINEIFNPHPITFRSNDSKYISEEQIALYKSNCIIEENIDVYIDDDISIFEKIVHVLKFNGKVIITTELFNMSDKRTLYSLEVIKNDQKISSPFIESIKTKENK